MPFGVGGFALPLVTASPSFRQYWRLSSWSNFACSSGLRGFEVVVDCRVGVVGTVVVDVLFCFDVYAAVLCLCAEGSSLVAPVHRFLELFDDGFAVGCGFVL